MFVSGGVPWDMTAAPGVLAPLGGLLSMFEGSKDSGGGIRTGPLLMPPAVPRTAACVVLSQPRNLNPPTSLAPYTKSSSPLTPPAPPLKFGVDRLLAVDPPKDSQSLGHPGTPLFTSPSATSSVSCPILPFTSGNAFGATTCPVITTATTTIHSNGHCPVLPSGVTCPVLSSSCGCDVTGGKCPTECGYYYTPQPLYGPHPAQLLPYASLYSSSMGTMGSHRHDVMGVPSTTHHGRRKRTWTRAVFSNLQRKGLEKRFQLQKYITKPDRRQLAATLGLTDAQVKVWFQNRRMKWRHAELKKREQQQLQQKQQQDQSTAGKEEQQQQKQQEVSSSPERGEISEDIHYIMENYDDDDDDDEEIDPVEGCLQEDCPQRDISVI